MRCLIYVAFALVVSPWIVVMAAKKATSAIDRSMQLTHDGSNAQLSARPYEEMVEEFARNEAQRQDAVVRQLERDAAARQAATLRLIEKQASERQASVLQKIRREASARQAAMMQKAQLEARKRNATSPTSVRGWPTR